MKSVFKSFGCILCLAIVISFAACGISTGINVSFNKGSNDNKESINVNVDGISVTDIDGDAVDKIVPTKENLVKNLEDAGYTITPYTSIDESTLSIDRVVAENGSKFIDITYGLSSKEADEIFKIYCDIYEDSNYYILARNGNYVYCVKDKKTFSKAGFTSTGNIGIQYINN